MPKHALPQFQRQLLFIAALLIGVNFLPALSLTVASTLTGRVADEDTLTLHLAADHTSRDTLSLLHAVFSQHLKL